MTHDERLKIFTVWNFLLSGRTLAFITYGFSTAAFKREIFLPIFAYFPKLLFKPVTNIINNRTSISKIAIWEKMKGMGQDGTGQ